MKQAVCKFRGQINKQSASELIDFINVSVSSGAKEIITIISSGGGSLSWAIEVYKHIINTEGIIFTAYVPSSIASSANILLLAFENRFALPTIQMVFHPAYIEGKSILTAEDIEDQQLQHEGQAEIIEMNTKMTKEEAIDIFKSGKDVCLSAQEIAVYGFVEIVEAMPPFNIDKEIIGIQGQ